MQTFSYNSRNYIARWNTNKSPVRTSHNAQNPLTPNNHQPALSFVTQTGNMSETSENFDTARYARWKAVVFGSAEILVINR